MNDLPRVFIKAVIIPAVVILAGLQSVTGKLSR